MLKFDIERSFFFSSALRFLSDTSITFTIIIIIAFSDRTLFIESAREIKDNYIFLFSIMILLLCYTIGLCINALSYFIFSGHIRDIECNIADDLTSFNSNHTKYLLDYTNIKRVFAIKNRTDYMNAARIVNRSNFVLKQYDVDVDYVLGIKQYLRNMTLVIIPLAVYLDRNSLFIFKQTLLIIVLCLLIAKFLIHLCAHLNFYYAIYRLNALYTLCRTFDSNIDTDIIDKKITKSADIVYFLLNKLIENKVATPST